MPDRSSGVAIVPRAAAPVLTGPMAFASLALGAGLVTRLSGLDRAGVSFCYFKALTGYACFTCGTTRAFGHLSRFDLPGALAIQPLVTTLILGLLLWGALDAVLALGSRRTVIRMEGRMPKVIFVVFALLAVVNWMYLLANGV
jgi:hypothetical protein